MEQASRIEDNDAKKSEASAAQRPQPEHYRLDQDDDDDDDEPMGPSLSMDQSLQLAEEHKVMLQELKVKHADEILELHNRLSTLQKAFNEAYANPGPQDNCSAMDAWLAADDKTSDPQAS